MWPTRSAAALMASTLVLMACGGPTLRAPADDPAAAAQRAALIKHFEQWRGVAYRYGGSGRAGMDCSAFIQLTYANVYGESLPRTTVEQVRLGEPVAAAELAPGDLVFFKTGLSDRHAGIYVGNGEFIHASSSRGVARSQLNSPYWQRHWWQARRPKGLP